MFIQCFKEDISKIFLIYYGKPMCPAFRAGQQDIAFGKDMENPRITQVDENTEAHCLIDLVNL